MFHRNYGSQFSQYLVSCACGNKTSKAFARKNDGKCKSCVTGVEQAPRGLKCPTCGEMTLTAYQKAHHYHCDGCTREADPQGYINEVRGLSDSYGD